MHPAGPIDAERCTLLVASVGGSPEPLVASILASQPARILFIFSAGSKSSLDHENDAETGKDNSGVKQRLLREGYQLDPGRIDPVTVDDPQDLEGIVKKLHSEATPPIEAWKNRGSNYNVLVDFTGGTKCMSVALGLLARIWPCRLCYVGGLEREKNGVGVVVSGKEQIVHFREPWDALGYQTTQETAILFNRGNCAAAAAVAAHARDRASAGPLKSALALWTQFLEVFALWDQFAHAKSLQRLKKALETRHLLAPLFPSKRIEELAAFLASFQPVLQKLTDDFGKPSREIVLDLVANASRRLREGRYDDSVARLYRAVEAFAQWRLSTEWNLHSTAHFPYADLPPALKMKWKDRDHNGPLKLGLVDAFQVLYSLQDPAGERFASLGLAGKRLTDGAFDWGKGAGLSKRNDSILAHGFCPMEEDSTKHLMEKVLALIEIDSAALVSFPQL